MIFRTFQRTILTKTLYTPRPSYNVLNHEKFQKKVEGKGKIMHFLYEFWEVLCYGSIEQARETKTMLKYMMADKKSAFMHTEITKTKKDLLKFIPFSFFLVIPGAELLLPPYLYLFPNAFPTTYLFDDQLHKRYVNRDRKQMNSQRFLFQLIKQEIPSIDNLRNNQDYNSRAIQHIVQEHTDQLMFHLNYKNMNSEQLVHLCKFMGMEFFRGTYTAMKLTKLIVNLPVYFTNLFYWITRNPERKLVRNVLKNWNVKLPFPWEDLKRVLLLRQINSHLKKVLFNIKQLQDQDEAFRINGFGNNDYFNIRNYARERGIPAAVIQKVNPTEDTEYAVKSLKRDWVDYCHNQQVFDNMKIWYTVLYYERYHRRIREDYETRLRKYIMH